MHHSYAPVAFVVNSTRGKAAVTPERLVTATVPPPVTLVGSAITVDRGETSWTQLIARHG
ncbi:hypothetical protein GCM10010176_093910 [Nonomuraea spiralis]|nr:hypothetical protein GCM10010176_093910 [Nonomuraea spiralis]